MGFLAGGELPALGAQAAHLLFAVPAGLLTLADALIGSDGLFRQLAEHVGLHPPPRQKKAAQHRRNSHPRQPQRRSAQRGSGTDIPQPPFCRKACGGKLGGHGKPAQRKPCQHQPH